MKVKVLTITSGSSRYIIYNWIQLCYFLYSFTFKIHSTILGRFHKHEKSIYFTYFQRMFCPFFLSHICIFGVPTLCATKFIDANRFCFLFHFKCFCLAMIHHNFRFSSTLKFIFANCFIALFRYIFLLSWLAFINNCMLLLCPFDRLPNKRLVTVEIKCKRA